MKYLLKKFVVVFSKNFKTSPVLERRDQRNRKVSLITFFQLLTYFSGLDNSKFDHTRTMIIKPFMLRPQACNSTMKRLRLSFMSQHFLVFKIFEGFFETNFRAIVSEAFKANLLKLILDKQ